MRQGVPMTSGASLRGLNSPRGTPRNEPWWKSSGPASIRVNGTVSSCSGVTPSLSHLSYSRFSTAFAGQQVRDKSAPARSAWRRREA